MAKRNVRLESKPRYEILDGSGGVALRRCGWRVNSLIDCFS
ncbi:MAG: hypothetical protein ACI4AH_04740 [Muribaculaceae bacterium]